VPFLGVTRKIVIILQNYLRDYYFENHFWFYVFVNLKEDFGGFNDSDIEQATSKCRRLYSTVLLLGVKRTVPSVVSATQNEGVLSKKNVSSLRGRKQAAKHVSTEKNEYGHKFRHSEAAPRGRPPKNCADKRVFRCAKRRLVPASDFPVQETPIFKKGK